MNPLLKSVITNEEAVELRRLEQEVYKNRADINYQMCLALLIINQERLYRATHKTFEAYVSEKFDLSRGHAYTLINAGKTHEALTEDQEFDAKDLPSISADESISLGVNRWAKESNIKDGEEA